MGGRRGWLATATCVAVIGLIQPADAAAGSSEPLVGKLWVARYNGPLSLNDSPADMALGRDGLTVFVTGASGFDAVTIAYDATSGAVLWQATYDGVGWEAGKALAVSPDGSMVFVTGQVNGPGNDDMGTIAYDAQTGDQLWLSVYNGTGDGDDIGRAITASPDGSMVFVTGESQGTNPNGQDFLTIGYAADDGSMRWVRDYDGGANDQPLSIAVAPDGQAVYVSGWVSGPQSHFEAATVSYDADTGAPRWLQRLSGPHAQSLLVDSVVVSPDGSQVMVAGEIQSSPTQEDFYASAYDALTGTVLWAARYDGSGGLDIAQQVVVSPDGSRVAVTGVSEGTTSLWDYVTLVYDASTGSPIWLRRFDGPSHGDDLAEALAFTPDGSAVIVTGWRTGVTSGLDYSTMAYDAADGSLQWLVRYNARFNDDDRPASVAISPDGSRVFVTGSSDGGATEDDYATVAYDVGTAKAFASSL